MKWVAVWPRHTGRVPHGGSECPLDRGDGPEAWRRRSRWRGQDRGVECVFCSIVDGGAPSWRVYENDAAMAFLDVAQATRGHTLVVPKKHASDIWALSEDEAAEVMRSVHRVAGQLLRTLRPVGLNVMQSNGAAAWQEVFHYHVHLVPRFGNDELTPPWSSTKPSPEQLATTQRRILTGS